MWVLNSSDPRTITGDMSIVVPAGIGRVAKMPRPAVREVNMYAMRDAGCGVGEQK